MDKPGFGVVTSLITALVVLGVISQRLRPNIPVSVVNDMGREQNSFMRAGRFESIEWHRMEPATFALARKRDRPVLVFIGSSTSRAARDLDATFATRDIARLLHQYFICVRLDAAENPEWANAFSPVSRMRLRFPSDSQLWMLNEYGEPLQFVGKMGGDDRLDAKALEPLLWDAANQFNQSSAGRALVRGAQQRADVDALESLSASGPVKLRDYHLGLLSSIDPVHGGFATGNMRALNPLAYRFLLLLGDLPAATSALDSLVQSPIVDLVDGGFFDQVSNVPPWSVVFDKHPVETSEMAHTLAVAYLLLGQPAYRLLSLRAMDAIQGPLSSDLYVTVGEPGITDIRERSIRHSVDATVFTNPKLSPDEEWIKANLGLDIRRNPQAVPYIATSVEEIDLTKLVSVLDRMQELRPPLRREATEVFADSHFSSIARTLETSRLLGSSRHLNYALRQLDYTSSSFLTSKDLVQHAPSAIGSPHFCLGDSLSYADARLQDFLATGRYPSLEEGIRVLRAAWKTYRIQPGEWVLTREMESKTLNASFPEIEDNQQESATAKVIRLLTDYGRVLGDREDGERFLEEAEATARRYGALALDGGVATAGIYCAAASILDDTYAIAVGPYAQANADQLARKCPNRLVTPAFGDLWKSLQQRGSGIYVAGETIRGPFTVAQAAALLPPKLNPPE